MIGLSPISSLPIAGSLAPGSWGFPLGSTPNSEDFSFANYGLQNANIVIQSVVGLHDSGQVDFGDSANNGQDGGNFIYRDWRKKTITLKGIVKADTRDLFEEKLDEMKKFLDEKNDILRYYTQGKFREINATCTNIVFDRQHYHVSFCPFSITFTVSDIYWRDADLVIYTDTALTANFNSEYTNTGNKETFPEFIVAINSGTCSQLQITLNGISFTYAGSLTAGDFLSINSKTKKVKKNSVDVDYIGPCPIFGKDSNFVLYDFGVGTYNIDINVKFSKNFL